MEEYYSGGEVQMKNWVCDRRIWAKAGISALTLGSSDWPRDRIADVSFSGDISLPDTAHNERLRQKDDQMGKNVTDLLKLWHG
jgi:hypothetical protein